MLNDRDRQADQLPDKRLHKMPDPASPFTIKSLSDHSLTQNLVSADLELINANR